MNDEELKRVREFIDDPITLTPTPGEFPAKPSEGEKENPVEPES